MALKTYGAIHLGKFIDNDDFDGDDDNNRIYWIITEAQPHVCMKLKALFPRIPKTAVVPFYFDPTPESCHDLLWFFDRYPMRISEKDAALLKRGRKTHLATGEKLESVLFPDYVPKPILLNPGKEARPYQIQAAEFDALKKRWMLGDDIGLGKTLSAILTMVLTPAKLPGIVVVQTHLPVQWQKEGIEKFTNLTTHIIDKTKPYSLPPADVYIIKYSCLAGWVDVFSTGVFKSAYFDEVQEVRRRESQKYQGAKVLSNSVQYCMGMTATPIYNYGDEIFNVLDIIAPGSLGDRYDFLGEWCSWLGKDKWKVKDPQALGTYLRDNYLFLRRTRAEVGRELPPINTIVQTIDYDHKEADHAEKIAELLAIKVVGGSFVERGQAARELDAFMRHQTGVAKARDVAAYVRILLENGEPVLLAGWHREVYKIWAEELEEFKPVMYTGTEGPAAKRRAKEAFIKGETDLFIISLRSGIGLDGLQHRCKTAVIGELDWSPAVMKQVIGRIDRDGQQDQVTALYLVCDFGSDPFIINLLGLKTSQADGIVDPLKLTTTQHSDESRIKAMAQSFLDARKSKH